MKTAHSVVQRQEVTALKQSVNEIDDNAFIIIMDADDVTGVVIGIQPHG